MKNDEIIKDLELCIQVDSDVCDKCPFYDEESGCLGGDIRKPALDLIKHQKAEIERLEKDSILRALRVVIKEKNDIKTEAIKDFAERLKELKHECGCNHRKKPVYAVVVEKIDNLVREMMEDYK